MASRFSEFIFPKMCNYVLRDFANGDEEISEHIAEGLSGSKIISGAHVFYIDICGQSAEDDYAHMVKSKKTPEELLAELSLPFPICYIEQPGDRVMVLPYHNSEVRICAAFFIEIGPSKIAVSLLASVAGKTQMLWATVNQEKPLWHEQLWTIATAYLRAFCNTLKNSTQIGYETVHRQINAKIGTHHFSRNIGKVIRIKNTPKEHVTPILTRSITWESSWFVRGHWRRKQGGLGKDRSGEYSIPNFTWVKHHVKGNKDSEPEKKIYIA